jgi:hypothetical protein
MLVTDGRRGPADASAYVLARFDALLPGAEPTPREDRALLALWHEVTRSDDRLRKVSSAPTASAGSRRTSARVALRAPMVAGCRLAGPVRPRRLEPSEGCVIGLVTG